MSTMALSYDPPRTSSLEDELAEATQDLLDLGGGGGGGPAMLQPQQRHRFLKSALMDDAPLPAPSPLLLDANDVTRIGKAFAIDPNARLTPIDDGDAPTRRRPTAIVINESNVDAATDAASTSSPQHALVRVTSDEHLPAAHLHRTVRSVTSSAGLLYEPPRNRIQTASPSLLAAQQQLQSQQWLNARGERVLDSKIEQRMSDLQKRLAQARSAREGATASGSTEGRAASPAASTSYDRTPAFFKESFPDEETEEVGEVGDGRSEGAATSSRPARVTRASSLGIAPMPLHLATPQTATAAPVTAEVLVKLHGNRRAEREAALTGGGDNSDDAPIGDETLISLDPSRSSPMDELDLAAGSGDTGGDNSSLISLPATTGTSSTASGRRRPHAARRRRSVGSQSHRTSGSVDEDDDDDTAGDARAVPFARDVSIRSFSVVGEKARGYVAYDVRITTRNGTTISILRRFSSFVALRKALLQESGGGDKALPPLPARRAGLLHKYAAHHLEKRRRALQSWLAHVMLDATWASSNALRQWVVGNDNEV